MVYLQNRRFLPANSPLRKDDEHFPDKSCEKRSPPLKRIYSTMQPYHHAYDHAVNKFVSIQNYFKTRSYQLDRYLCVSFYIHMIVGLVLMQL